MRARAYIYSARRITSHNLSSNGGNASLSCSKCSNAHRHLEARLTGSIKLLGEPKGVRLFWGGSESMVYRQTGTHESPVRTVML